MYLQTLVCMLFPFLSSSSPVPAAGPQSEKTRTGAQFQTQNTSSYIEEVTLSLTVPVPPAWPNQTADSFQFFPAVGTDKANIVVRPTFQSFANPAEYVSPASSWFSCSSPSPTPPYRLCHGYRVHGGGYQHPLHIRPYDARPLTARADTAEAKAASGAS